MLPALRCSVIPSPSLLHCSPLPALNLSTRDISYYDRYTMASVFLALSLGQFGYSGRKFATASRLRARSGRSAFHDLFQELKRKVRGETPNCRLKQRLKWAESLNPQKNAISVMLRSADRGSQSSMRQRSRRRWRIHSVIVEP